MNLMVVLGKVHALYPTLGLIKLPNFQDTYFMNPSISSYYVSISSNFGLGKDGNKIDHSSSPRVRLNLQLYDQYSLENSYWKTSVSRKNDDEIY